MASCRESRKEAATLTTLLTTRKTFKIGTWNIRTIFDLGKTLQVAREIHNYNLRLVLLGFCETRWKQSEQLRLTIGEMELYSNVFRTFLSGNVLKKGRLKRFASPICVVTGFQNLSQIAANIPSCLCSNYMLTRANHN